MCKHNKNYTITEIAETALIWNVEGGKGVGGTQETGNISPMVEFMCHDCGLKRRFNYITTQVGYLKTAYATAVYQNGA